MQGVTFKNYSGEGVSNIPGQAPSNPINSLQELNITNIANDILISIFSYSDLPSFGIINQVCRQWESVNNESLVIASVFQKHYNKFKYDKSSEKFIEFVLKNLNALTFEKKEFHRMFECVCDERSHIEISDSEVTKKIAVKLADYLPQDKGHVTTLPTSLYLLMSPGSRIKLTKDEKIELLLKYAEKNPGMISYNLRSLRRSVGIEQEDIIKLSKKCIAQDPRTLFYINLFSGLDISLLKQIQEENNIKDEDLNRIKNEALELYFKDGEMGRLKSDGKPFILGQ